MYPHFQDEKLSFKCSSVDFSWDEIIKLEFMMHANYTFCLDSVISQLLS